MAVLDGGLATALEARGHDLNDALWSARVLLDDPEAVGRVHREYLAAGADCIATATYQATLAGFAVRGLDSEAATGVLKRAVDLAASARDAFWAEPENRKGRARPLVAGSVGPYGAFLANGSEYTGRYDLDDRALYEFHRSRWRILAESGADLIACETIPSGPEVQVLLRLLDETPGVWAWISFSCGPGAHLADGTPLARAARWCDAHDRVAAVGVNCVPPSRVPELIADVRKATRKPVAAYPNSGERYDAASKRWGRAPTPYDLPAAARDWVGAGASVVGGCCRVGPRQITEIRRAILA